MSAGQFVPPPYNAVVAFDPAVVTTSTRHKVVKLIEYHDFVVAELPVQTADDMARILTRACNREEMVVYIGNLPIHELPPVFRTIDTHLDRPIPGVVDLIRNVLLDTGYTRVVFERVLAGWAGATLVITLPNDIGGISDLIMELVPMYDEFLDPVIDPGPTVAPRGGPHLTVTDGGALDRNRRGRLGSAGGVTSPGGGLGEGDSNDTATILRMPTRRQRDGGRQGGDDLGEGGTPGRTHKGDTERPGEDDLGEGTGPHDPDEPA